MRKICSFVAAGAFVLSLGLPALAQNTTTITGEVVDVACALKKGEGGKGEAHAKCAMACAKKGQQVGIMTDDAVYNVVGDYAANNNAKLLDFVAKRVTVTGTVAEKDGQKTITIASIKPAS